MTQPLFEPTITLGNILTIVVAGIPAIWWASKLTQIVKNHDDDIRKHDGDIDKLREESATKEELKDLRSDFRRSRRNG